MKAVRILLIVANTAAMAALLAIPVGNVLGFIEQEIDAAAVFGWFMFFIPLFGSAAALLGTQSHRLAFMRPLVIIGMPGSFLVAFLSAYAYWKGPADFALISITATVLFALNVLVLWEPFKRHIGHTSR